MAHLLEHVRRQAVGYLALFIALTGTTYAAVNLPNRSVTGKKIARKTITDANLKTNSVTARAIRANAVRGSEVLESSLGTIPLADNALKLEGNSLAQVRSGIDAATLGGSPRSAFYDASEVEARLPRAAEKRSVGEQSFTSANPVDRLSLDLVAPEDGFAFVVASGNVHPSGTVTAGHQCAVQMSVNEIPQVGRIESFSAGDTSIEYHSLANSWIVPVTAGTNTFTVRFSINTNVSTDCSDSFNSSSTSLNALWIPNAG
jgi:hypothetical protein